LHGVDSLDELAEALRARLVDQARTGELAGSVEDEVRALVEREAAALPEASRAELCSRVMLLATGLGPLEPLLADPSVDEVMVNGPEAVYVERRGRLERAGVRSPAKRSCCTRSSVSWPRWVGGWTKPRRCATRAWPTARG
jgi:pilus assembly protein CpaF